MTPVPGCSVWRLSDNAERWFDGHRARIEKETGARHSDYEYALKAFGDLPFRSILKHEFLLLCECHQWTRDFELERDGIVNEWAIRMAKGFCMHKRLNLMGCGSSWKCLHGDMNVIMFNGCVKNVKDIVVGDVLMGDDNTPRNVLKLHRGRSPMYRVTPKKGEAWICNSPHILCLQATENRMTRHGKPNEKRKAGTIIEISADKFYNSSATFKNCFKQYKVGIDLPEKPLPVDPYCYGAWLADGSIRGQTIWKPECNMTRYWCAYWKSKGYRITNEKGGTCDGWSPVHDQPIPNEARRFFRSSSPEGEKRIFQEFLLNSRANRLQLLAGLLDGDGHACDSGFEILTKFDGLKKDIQYLANSLGFFVTHRIRRVKGNDYHFLYITGKVETIPTKDKIASGKSSNRNSHATKIDLEPLPEDDFFGFEIDGNHRFLLEDFTVTHNTGNASAYAYTAWKTNPFCTSVFLSTTSGEAAQSRTWGQVKDWHSKDRYAIGNRIESLHLITLDKETKDDEGNKNRDFRNSLKVVLIKPGNEGKNVMASIVGRKNENVIWIVDEFPFMDIGILNARVNLNTAGPFHQFIGLGNAPEEGDPMYLDAEPHGENYPDGWRSITKDDQGWTTKTGVCLYFNGEKSPNYKVAAGKKFPFPRMMNEGFRLEIMKDAGGEDTPMYWKQFYGFPPTVDISDKVLTYKLLAQNGAFEQALWLDTNKKALAGLDLGFREGGDPCVICFGKLGKNTDERRVLETEADAIPLLPRQGSTDAFEVQIAKRVIEECRKRGCHDLALDVTGDGGILLQHIEREARQQAYKLTVTPISFSGTAEDSVVIPGEDRTAKEMFANRVAELWGTLRVSVLNKVLCGLRENSNVTTQLCARKMGSDDRKRMTIEKKKDMKKRLRRSPDHADALALLHHLALKHGLSGMVVPPKKPKPPVDPMSVGMAPAKRYVGHSTGRYGGR